MEDTYAALEMSLRASSFFFDGHRCTSGASDVKYRLNQELFEATALVKFIMLNFCSFSEKIMLYFCPRLPACL